MLISELLQQPDVTLNDGDYLASNTEKTGYVPSHKDTANFDRGRYVFKLVQTATGMNVVPVINNEEGTEYVDDEVNPVVIQSGDKLVYQTGRNHPDYHDGYHGRQFYEVEVKEGEEAQQILLAFIEFVKSEYSMGVNDFTLEGPTYLGDGSDSDPEGP
ncbi:Ig domain containing protein [Bacillus phage Shbh1]|uniref:Uncharacterized protein n=1 Tax=Bacillus phage Shbh1 TaxID=1796992 RepID=A0A142F1J2_9CAUD|nr:Ig domain containing protein [Bacillus phage Shbh1]AMQ66649.1 hypothetical protein [Bacillus phage Shbh1]